MLLRRKPCSVVLEKLNITTNSVIVSHNENNSNFLPAQPPLMSVGTPLKSTPRSYVRGIQKQLESDLQSSSEVSSAGTQQNKSVTPILARLKDGSSGIKDFPMYI